MVKILKYVTVVVAVMFAAGMLPIAAIAQAAPTVSPCAHCAAAPAPLIGTGLMVGLALGAVLLGTLLINRRRGRSAD